MIGKVEQVLRDDKTVAFERESTEELHVICPWHGWEYDLENGECATDRRLRLRSVRGRARRRRALRERMTRPPLRSPTSSSSSSSAELLKEYVDRVQATPPGPLPPARWATRLNATECALVSVDLLRGAEITSFELAAMFNI